MVHKDAYTTVTIDDITIADGMATDFVPGVPDLAAFANGGGLLNLSGNVTLNNVHVTGNSTQNDVGSGGGVSSAFGASLTVNQSMFTDNRAFGLLIGAGGAIVVDGFSALSVNDSMFSGNTAIAATGFSPDVTYSGLAAGGAIAGGNGTSASIAHSQFENNTAKGGDGIPDLGQGAGFAIGGAINFSNVSLLGDVDQSSLDVSDSTFSGNQAIGGQGADGPEGVRGGDGGTAYGGAMFLSFGAEASVASSRFNGNQVTVGDGGKGGAGADGGDTGNYGDGTFVNGHGGAILG